MYNQSQKTFCDDKNLSSNHSSIYCHEGEYYDFNFQTTAV